jgi:hypothetical protein
MTQLNKTHGIIIIHGVGRHKKLDVLTSFATGLLETMRVMAPRPEVAIQSLKEISCRADLDVGSRDNYVDVSLRDDEVVFRVREAYWQRAFQPQPAMHMWRWLWQTITRLMAWENKRRLRLLGAGSLVLQVGQVLLGLIVLRSLFRWLGQLLPLPSAWVQAAPTWLRAVAQFLFPAQYPLWARLLAALPVVFLALAVVVLLVSLRAMWTERAMPAGWTRRIPWPVGIVAVGVAGWMYLVLQLEALLRSFPLGFPGRNAIAGVLGVINTLLQQDAVGDAGIFASDELRAASVRQTLEQQVARFCDEGYESIHVVGHSLGGIISFEVLARTLSPQIRERITNFFSVGSPLKKFIFLLDEPQAAGDVRRKLDEWKKIPSLSWLAGVTARVLDMLVGGMLGGAARRPIHRFEGLKITDITWHNIVADWDLAPDTLEDKEDVDLGKVVDVPVKSTRKLGAHSGYWDTGCETMRYILEQIEPDVFGQELHVQIHGAPKVLGPGEEAAPGRKEIIRAFVEKLSR